jgi:predicted permease
VINLRFAFRLLAKTPFVTTVAIASLALGIGANTAIFSLFNQLLLRPLPVPHADQLVNLADPGPNPGSQSCSEAGGCDEVFSYPMFRDLQREQKVFTDIAAHVGFGANLTARNQTISDAGELVSGSYFPVLGLHATIGRLLDNNDDRAISQSRVAVLSYDYWQRWWGADPGVINQVITVNGQLLTIVGVAPRGFTGTTVGVKPSVFVPITLRGEVIPGWKGFERRDSYWIYLFARRKEGVSLKQAAVGINIPYRSLINNVEASLQKGMSDKTMVRFKAKQVTVKPGLHGQSSLAHQASGTLFLLLGVTAFVLLIACANIANLLLARGASRAGEMAVRLSIGGSRLQLVGQLLAESCLLALAGGAASLVVARLTLGAMASLLPQQADYFNVHLDATVVCFTFGLTLLTAFGFGLFPALYATRPDLIATLRASTGQPSGGRAAARWRSGLAIGQVALSMALLASAGLFTRSLANLSRVDLGVQIDHVVTFSLSPELNGYNATKSMQTLLRARDAVHALPGVRGVSLSMVPLIANSNWGNDVNVEGFPSGPDVDNNSRFNEVSAGYFSMLGVPLMTGREFTEADGATAPLVAVVNQTFARKFNLGTNPVGRRMDQGDKKLDIEIVGLVQDSKYSSVKDAIPPLFFIPLAQDSGVGSVYYYVRTSQTPEQLLRLIPPVIANIDHDLPVENLRTMPEQIRENISLDRFISIFSATFAILATLLAAIGLYGVLAYTVAQRTREIGVRMALGAAPRAVRAMVLRQVGWMTLIGAVIGVAAALAVGRAAQSMLYQLNGYDPVVIGGAVILLSLVALTAGFVPAHRASRVEPTQALRQD